MALVLLKRLPGSRTQTMFNIRPCLVARQTIRNEQTSSSLGALPDSFITSDGHGVVVPMKGAASSAEPRTWKVSSSSDALTSVSVPRTGKHLRSGHACAHSRAPNRCGRMSRDSQQALEPAHWRSLLDRAPATDWHDDLAAILPVVDELIALASLSRDGRIMSHRAATPGTCCVRRRTPAAHRLGRRRPDHPPRRTWRCTRSCGGGGYTRDPDPASARRFLAGYRDAGRGLRLTGAGGRRGAPARELQERRQRTAHSYVPALPNSTLLAARIARCELGSA
jgi:hypothetical protein